MKDITQSIVRELLDYDPVTGHLTWVARDESRFSARRHCLTWNTKNAGKRAGTEWENPRTGYRIRQISLLGRRRLEHQIVWVYMAGFPLPDEIDHINQDATDNRWCNLRASNHTLNGWNGTKKSTNTSGKTGVYWHKRARKWLAYCTQNGKYNYLGLFSDIEDAAIAVEAFRKDSGFYSSHGVSPAPYRS